MDEFAKEAKSIRNQKAVSSKVKVSSLEEITALAKLPNREGLLSMLAICTTSASPQRGLRCQSSGRQRRWRCSLIAA